MKKKQKIKTLVKEIQKFKHNNKVVSANRMKIGENISFCLDIMSDPRFRDEIFRAIEQRTPQSYTLHAANDEITIHFEMEWNLKGGE